MEKEVGGPGLMTFFVHSTDRVRIGTGIIWMLTKNDVGDSQISIHFVF